MLIEALISEVFYHPKLAWCIWSEKGQIMTTESISQWGGQSWD